MSNYGLFLEECGLGLAKNGLACLHRRLDPSGRFDAMRRRA